MTGGLENENGRETGERTNLTPVPQALSAKAFPAKTGGREGYFAAGEEYLRTEHRHS